MKGADFAHVIFASAQPNILAYPSLRWDVFMRSIAMANQTS